ncbi:MAG: glycosyltransferase [Candidatus Eremiobacteraeota bacterium]|nr:glycosyltransferase [Candidatus Eremiobacteraeota bacterium]
MKNTVPSLDHLLALSDDTGIIQHAFYDVPNRSTGYCTDDVSRAFIVALAKLQLEPRHQTAIRLASTYLSFLCDAQMQDGRFHNFMSFQRTWLDDVGTQDSFGRAVWALGYGIRYAPRESWKNVCARLLNRTLQAVTHLEYLRSKAYTIIGLSFAAQSGSVETSACEKVLRPLADDLKNAYLENHDVGWQWFEQSMTYDNARLPQALLQAGAVLGDDEFIEIGLRTLSFYESIVIENGMFVPIGNEGWYVRGGRRARFGQQPLEASALIDASLAALDVTSDPALRALAQAGVNWFYGHNTSGAGMVSGGGCKDGIDELAVNSNMGAESTISYLAGAFALAERPRKSLKIVR